MLRFHQQKIKLDSWLRQWRTPLHRAQPLRSHLCVLCCPAWEHLALTGRASLAGHSKTNWWMRFLNLRSDRKMRPHFIEFFLGHCGCLPAEDKPLSVSTAAIKRSDIFLLTLIAADQALSCLQQLKLCFPPHFPLWQHLLSICTLCIEATTIRFLLHGVFWERRRLCESYPGG